MNIVPPSLFSGNLFSPLNPGEWVLVMLFMGTQRRKFLNSLLHFPSPCAFMGWWGGRGNCSLGYSPRGSRRRGCDVVTTLVVAMIWTVQEAVHVFSVFSWGLRPLLSTGEFSLTHTGYSQVSDLVAPFFQDVTFSINYIADL